MFTSKAVLLAVTLYAVAVEAGTLCRAQHEEMVGTDIIMVPVSGSSHEELDSNCCKACSSTRHCEFWVRQSASSGTASCWLKKDFTGHEASTTRRSAFAWDFPWNAADEGSPGQYTCPADFGLRGMARVRVRFQNTFALNFYDSAGAILFHFNTRDGNLIVENARSSSGVWGTEQRPSAFPFTSGKVSWLLIELREADFEVWVDGVHYATLDFGYRLGFDPTVNVISHAELSSDMDAYGVDFSSGLTSAPTAAPTVAAVSALQQHADDWCESQAACDNKMCVARRDVGTESQQTAAWRCYNTLALDWSATGSNNCVDNCGNLIACQGAVDGASTSHHSLGSGIEAAIDSHKTTTCTSAPTSAPTAAPTTAEEALEEALGLNGHDTAFDASTGKFYVCSDSESCFVSTPGSRAEQSFQARSTLPASAVFDNYSQIQAADGLVDGDIAVDLLGWTFKHANGNEYWFPFQCLC